MVLPGVAVATTEELVRVVADAMAQGAGTDAQHIEAAFLEAMRGEGFSIGRGVAIPHTELASLTETVVCLATLQQPLTLRTVDGVAPDIFLFILSKADPHAHLLLLAHLARLTQSRTLLDGLRRARAPEEALALIRAAELRHKSLPSAAGRGPAPTHAMFVVSLGGEAAVDALLIDWVDQGLGDASVLEAQSVREAAAREVPLFAGFRDLFGDPGGRRILILEAEVERTDAIIETVKRISQEHHAKDARVSVIPIQTRWSAAPVVEEEATGGH